MPQNKKPHRGERLNMRQSLKMFGRLVGIMFRKYPVLCVVAILAICLSVLASTIGSFFTGSVLVGGYITYALTGSVETSGSSLQPVIEALVENTTLLQGVLILAGIYTVGFLCTYVYQILVCVIGQGTQKSIRDQLFKHMETLPLSYFDQRVHGDIMSVYTNDVDTLRELTSRVLPMMIQSIVQMLACFVMMVILSWYLTIVVIFFTILILVTISFTTSRSSKYFIAQQRALGATDGYIEEMISGQKVVKVFNHEEKAKEGFDELNDALCEYTTKAQKYSMISGPVANNLGNIQYVTLALIGGLIIAANTENPILGVGVIISFLSLGKAFTMPIAQLANQINMFILAMAGAERIFAIMDEQSETDEGYVTLVNAIEGSDGEPVEVSEKTGKWAWKHPHTATGDVSYTWLKGKINMYGVDFAYIPGKTVLHDISLWAEPGQKVAFVGPTGAGKTTITNLLNRFYDIEDGKIRFDDININKIKKGDLRRAMGMVLQDTNLFTGTVKENIRYGNPEATDEQVIESAKLANAHNFIMMLPQGYDTVLEKAGADLSQGQRQLLSIARAACANPPVLVLDEATSSIDSRTEKLVQQGMDAIMNGRTVFVIAHRLSTIQNSDVIMVLEQGHIIERGSHDDLIKAKGKYYQLYTGGQVTSNE